MSGRPSKARTTKGEEVGESSRDERIYEIVVNVWEDNDAMQLGENQGAWVPKGSEK